MLVSSDPDVVRAVSDAIVGKLAAPSQGGLAAPDGGPALTLASRRSP
ncbi:MAG TPA: hypothetical protein VH539_24070 [Gemmatimonadaceae bacterium]